ncbi:MAG: hypothetical protein ABSH15_16195 [Verrucomicrobiota bacterium]
MIPLAELREKIAVGLEQVKRGEVVDGKEVINRLLEKNRQHQGGSRQTKTL